MELLQKLHKTEKWLYGSLLVLLYAFLLLTYPASVGDPGFLLYWFVNFDFTIFVSCTWIAAHFLLQRYFVKGRYTRFFISYLIVVLAGTTAILVNDLVVLSFYPTPDAPDQLMNLVVFFTSTFGMLFLISSGGVSIRALSHWIRSQQQLNAIRREQLQTELAFLRSQMNPHFLFNTINLVFGHIDRTNKTARDIIVRFSDILRYQLYECDVPYTSIEKEVDYLQHYVSLQQLRKNDNLSCSVKLSGDLKGFEIPPLLLIPFVENAFKYVGSEEGQRNFLKVELHDDKDHFYFSCVNSKSALNHQDVIKTKGIGLQNVRRRLELLYPDQHVLQIEDLEHSFEVYLTIKR